MCKPSICPPPPPVFIRPNYCNFTYTRRSDVFFSCNTHSHTCTHLNKHSCRFLASNSLALIIFCFESNFIMNRMRMTSGQSCYDQTSSNKIIFLTIFFCTHGACINVSSSRCTLIVLSCWLSDYTLFASQSKVNVSRGSYSLVGSYALVNRFVQISATAYTEGYPVVRQTID